MHEWSAEVSVDGDLAQRLIAGQFGAVEPAELRLLSEGWDNTVWLADRRWVFRFPRRASVIPGVEREMALLPRLAPLVPLRIPEPAFFGRPAEGYPWPFFGAALIPGRELADAACTDADRRRLARPLAAFLRTLHGAGVAAAVDPAGELPSDPMGRGDMALRVPRTAERLEEVERLGLWRPLARAHEVLDAARGLPAPEPSALVHGDLHIRHLLVDERCGAAGVIDWVDICRGDPAIDLPLLWSSCPRAGGTSSSTPTGPSPTPSCFAPACSRCSCARRSPSTRATRRCPRWSARRSARSSGRRPIEQRP